MCIFENRGDSYSPCSCMGVISSCLRPLVVSFSPWGIYTIFAQVEDRSLIRDNFQVSNLMVWCGNDSQQMTNKGRPCYMSMNYERLIGYLTIIKHNLLAEVLFMILTLLTGTGERGWLSNGLLTRSTSLTVATSVSIIITIIIQYCPFQ